MPTATKEKTKRKATSRKERMKIFDKYINDVNKHTDSYHNSIDFPDEIMSDMTTKGILSHQIDTIINVKIEYAMFKYHMRTRNIDAGYKNFVTHLFQDAIRHIDVATPILEDFVNRNIYGLEEILCAMFGEYSDEVYIYRKFNELAKRINEWDEKEMWTDCSNDERLKGILCGKRQKMCKYHSPYEEEFRKAFPI